MDYLRYRLLEEDENYMQSYGKKSESVIYWQDNVTDYTEAKRLVAPIHFGRRQVVQFQWTSPIEPIKKIRWDITDRAALIEVFDCILVNQAYEITWRWNVSDELFTSMSDHLKVLRKSRKDQILGLLATGNDPYIEMCIPIDLVSTIDMNWQLLIDCKIDIPTRAIAFLL
jgi:hypothetical protein